MNILKYTLLLLIFLAPAGCHPDQKQASGEIIPKDKFIDIMYDVHMVDAMLHEASDAPPEKKLKALTFYPSLLEKHGVTRAAIDSSINFYIQHPKEFARIYDEVYKRIEAKTVELKDSEDFEQMNGK
ncbi:MAG: DUF4296 domain-containing protein [Bacteroidales bacterium]|nr:DUF4296 domain-containing protein [Bacteroidales bacterium]